MAWVPVGWGLQTVEAFWLETGAPSVHGQPDAVDPDQSFGTVLRAAEDVG